jgi:hypothetical protein
MFDGFWKRNIFQLVEIVSVIPLVIPAIIFNKWMQLWELLPNGLTCLFCVVGNIFFDFCVNLFFRFVVKLPKLVHGIVLRIQLVIQIMWTFFQTGFTHSIELANLTRADALVNSFPSTINNSWPVWKIIDIIWTSRGIINDYSTHINFSIKFPDYSSIVKIIGYFH